MHIQVPYLVPGEWKRQVIGAENSGVMHGIYVLDWDGDGRDEILTASFDGIHLFHLARTGTGPAPKSPAATRRRGPSRDRAISPWGVSAGTRFLAAIEPSHGNQVGIYQQANSKWERQAI